MLLTSDATALFEFRRIVLRVAIAKILDFVAHRVDSCIEYGTEIECIDTLLQWLRLE